MKILQIIIAGIGKKRLICTIYIIQFVFAISIGLQVYSVLDASIGNSLSIEGLKLGNAHMVINDLINVHGASLSPLLGQVRWLILVYLFMAAFIHGGIWYSLIGPGNKNSFWIGGANYFGRCLAIGIFFNLVFIIWTSILWIPYVSNVTNLMESLISEVPIVWGGIFITLLWSIGTIYIFISSSYSKVFLIKDNLKVVRSIKGGIIYGVKNAYSLLPMLMVFATILLLLYSLPALIDEWGLLTSTVGIFILFFIQQFIVWMKIALRISTYKYLLDQVQ